MSSVASNGKSKIRIGQLLGSGGQATVYLGEWEGVQVAVKVFKGVPGNKDGPFSSSILNIEADVAERLRHPNVVQFFTYDVLPSVIPPTAGSSLELWTMRIVQEYCCHGALRESLNAGTFHGQTGPRTPPDCTAALVLALDVACGLAYIHNNGVIHGDMKAANVLLSSRDAHMRSLLPDGVNVPLAKIADFGMSKMLSIDESHVSVTPGKAQGTITHMAPEMFSSARLEVSVDVYAFGIFMYELLSGARAWEGKNMSEILAAVVRGERPSFPPSTPRQVLKLAMECLDGDPFARPSMEDVKDRLQEFLGVSGNTKSMRSRANSLGSTISRKEDNLVEQLRTEVSSSGYNIRSLQMGGEQLPTQVSSSGYDIRRLQMGG